MQLLKFSVDNYWKLNAVKTKIENVFCIITVHRPEQIKNKNFQTIYKHCARGRQNTILLFAIRTPLFGFPPFALHAYLSLLIDIVRSLCYRLMLLFFGHEIIRKRCPAGGRENRMHNRPRISSRLLLLISYNLVSEIFSSAICYDYIILLLHTWPIHGRVLSACVASASRNNGKSFRTRRGLWPPIFFHLRF